MQSTSNQLGLPMTRRMLKNQQFVNISKQGGWTFWSLLFTLSVILFFSYVGMQLVPVYSANENVKNAMERSVSGTDLRKVSRAKVIKGIDRQLYLDGSHKLIDYKKQLKITRSRSMFTVEANYERRIPLFGNLSIVASFHPKVECHLTRGCDK